MSFGPEDLTSYVHLTNLLDGIRQRTLKYCAAAETPEGRFARVMQMNAVFTGNGELPDEVNLACPPCLDNEHCEGGACVPDTAFSGLPADNEQSTEEA
jgi:hypothetical protein